MVNAKTPAEIEIDESLVRSLLRSQIPELSDEPLAVFNNGWDNDIWSLGKGLLVRLPRRAAAADLIVHEQTWLPMLGSRLSIPIPVPVHAGFPGEGFPWHWSVVPVFRGDVAARSAMSDPIVQATRLAEFLRELHVEAPSNAPMNPFRGVPVARVAEKYRIRMARQHERLVREGRDVESLDRMIEEGERAPVHCGPASLLHGDMHPGNVLVNDGDISAVIDWGDICSGDPACDMQVAWMLFTDDALETFFETYGAQASGVRERSRAWAVGSAMVYLDNDDGDPLMTLMGNTVLDRVLSRPVSDR